ncbi:hypothetical protein FQZ97_828150 [compost metagenome]
MKEMKISIGIGLMLTFLDAIVRGIHVGVTTNMHTNRFDSLISSVIFSLPVMLVYFGVLYIILVFVFIKTMSTFKTSMSIYIIGGIIYTSALFIISYLFLGLTDAKGTSPIISSIFYPISGLILGYLVFRYKTKNSII